MAFRKTSKPDDLLAYLRAQIEEKFDTIQAFANKHDMPASYISNILRGERSVPEWMLKKFKVKKVTTTHWEPA